MQRYVALLRGINVGGHRVSMDRLRALFVELGFHRVSTFIASGNVIFSADSEDVAEITDAIEGHLERELGYPAATFLRTPEELAAIVAYRPERERSFSSHYVMFLRTPAPDSLCRRLSELESEADRFECAGREIHWRIEGKLSESPLFGKDLDRATAGVAMTMRNMNTLRRLVAKTTLSEGG